MKYVLGNMQIGFVSHVRAGSVLSTFVSGNLFGDMAKAVVSTLQGEEGGGIVVWIMVFLSALDWAEVRLRQTNRVTVQSFPFGLGIFLAGGAPSSIERNYPYIFAIPGLFVCQLYSCVCFLDARTSVLIYWSFFGWG